MEEESYLYKETEYLKVFPEIEEVFEKDVEIYKKWVLPLCSIDLSIINSLWSDKIYAIYFNNDPYNPDPAMLASFNEYNNEYMISFKLVDGKYELNTSFDYFRLTEDWTHWHKQGMESYQIAKKRFKEKGFLNPYEEGTNYSTTDSYYLVADLGKFPEDLPMSFPLDPDGNKMEFICRLETGHYVDDFCDEEMYIFYSPKHKLVVQSGYIT
jgi:hypothetical protein